MHLPTSPIQLLIIAVVVMVLFGQGKVSSLMGDFGKGITAFKKGLETGASETADNAKELPPEAIDRSPHA